ncbi:MAG TPA: VOC family protein, partial [Bacteroidia bacterium]|nr:VOC family protein [Bacteroidia bacterium]
MATLHPHINFNGNAREAFEFYRSVFGGEFSRILYLKELAGPDVPIADEDADKLLHIALPVGTGMLIGNDVPSFLG